MAFTPDSSSLRPLQHLQAELRHAGERRLVLIEGDRHAALHWLAAELPFLSTDQGLWVSTKADSPLPALHESTPAQARTWLGRELDLLVWDGFSGNPPDGLAALAGALTAGGLWFWLMPPLSQWGTFADPDYARTGLDQTSEHPFARRLATILCDAPDVIRLNMREGASASERARDTINSELARARDELSQRQTATAFCISGGIEQSQLVQALLRFGLGRRRRPLVVTADRGRGKSAALGLAAAGLLLQGRQRVLLTAPSAEQIATVMAHARERLGTQLQSQTATELTTIDGASLTFLLPQQLLADKPAAEVVMVDEAAAIAAPLLQRILLGWPRVAFATTVHGYEGAGRGFAVRFREQLDQHTPHWQERTLSQPVRWAASDPLEPLVFRLFLLAAKSQSNAQQPTPDALPALEIERWQPALATENDLAEAFGLLVNAHYRTTPADLRQWLDDPAAVSWRARINGRTVGLVWAQGEGEFSAPLAQQVSLGQRRLRGHLLAQSLALHAGLPQAAQQRGLRVTRIAVAAPQRRSGIGQRLIAAAQAYATTEGFDYIGSSFGGTPELLAFWQGQRLQPVRLGFSQEASSGEYPLQAVCGLSAVGKRLVQDLQQRLGRHWLVLASRQWVQCQPELMVAVMRSLPAGPQPDAEDTRDLQYFAAGHRGFELTLPALRTLSRCAGAADWLSAIQPVQSALWCRAVVQGRSWAELQHENLCSGRRDAEQQLRYIVAGWLALG
jgi:tRNA(Met) cytidine acetyltransferase